MANKKLYKLNDDILFRVCTLGESGNSSYGDCTNFTCSQVHWKDFFTCNQFGIHYHCAKHPEIELNIDNDSISDAFYCPKCKKKIDVRSFDRLRSECLKLLNQEAFKNAELIRLDDWYVPELKKKIKTDTSYWIESDIKTDKDGDTIIILYVGHKGEQEKVQYFIKPEKCQLSSDHKDLDPSKIISKIEVTLKDRSIIQKFDDINK